MNRRARAFLVGLSVVAGLILNFDSLLLHLGDHLPGNESQAAASLLGVWWPAYKTAVPDGLVVHSYVGAPYLTNHLRDMPVLQSAAFALLRPVAGPVAGFNLLLILSQAAMHLALFLLLARWGAPPLWAGLAALAFSLSPWYTAAVAQADLVAAGFWTLPLALLVWERWLDQPSTWRAVTVAAVLYAAVLSGVQNTLWIAAVWLPYAVFTGRRQWREPGGREGVSVAILIGLVLVLAYPLPDFVRALQGSEPAYGPPLGAPESRSLVGWALRTGPALLLVAVITLFRARFDRRLLFWLAVAGFAFAVSAGLLPDPFHMLLGGLGLPYRPLAGRDYFSGPLLFALLAGACHAWREEISRSPMPLSWKGIAAGLLLAALAGNPASWRSLPQHSLAVPGFYQQIAAEPEDYLLLEYPFGLSSQADERTLGDAAYLARYAVWHQKRPVSGLAPYFEPLAFDQAQASSFLFPAAVGPDDREAAAQALGVAVREWRIGYVVVHPELLASDNLEALRDLAGDSGALCPPVEREGLIVYRALWHPAGCEAP